MKGDTGRTRYMRLDGQTRPAPHYYVEALMKQIKFPDLNAFVITDKGSLCTKKHGVIPFILSINNFSKFITAFNVHYSLIIDYGTFFFDDEDIVVVPDGRSELDCLITKTLHYNKPALKEFYLILPEAWNSRGQFNIVVMFYADNSPIKISRYIFEYFHSPSSPTPQINLLEKLENEFTFNLSPSIEKSEKERIFTSSKVLLNKMKSDLWNKTMFKKLQQL